MLIGTIVDKNIEYGVKNENELVKHEKFYYFKIKNNSEKEIEIQVNKEIYDKYKINDVINIDEDDIDFTTREIEELEDSKLDVIFMGIITFFTNAIALTALWTIKIKN